jgi:hypothetical protein
MRWALAPHLTWALALAAGGYGQQIAFAPASLAEPANWEAQPTWLPNPAGQHQVQRTAEGLEFRVQGAGLGMKWLSRLAPPAEVEETPWLVIRYRCLNYDPKVDYLLWLDDSAHEGGLYLVTAERLRADGQWHTLAADLEALGCETVRAVAVQCKAAEESGQLTLARLGFVAFPPAEAESIPPRAQAGLLGQVEPGPAGQWHAQPGWLGNPSGAHQVTDSQQGVCFTVREAGRGMKWSRDLSEPLAGGYFKLRYRAWGLSSWADYALYAANAPGGQAPQEQKVILLSELRSDGRWHVAVAYCRVPQIRTLAVQVQAEQTEAGLELGRLEVWGSRPPVALTEECAAQAGWPAKLNFFAPQPPPGGTSQEGIESLLRLQGWWPAEKITVEGIPFWVGHRQAAATQRGELGAIEVPVPGRWAQLYLLLGAALPSREAPGYTCPARAVSYPHRFVCELQYQDGLREQQIPTCLAGGQPEVREGVGVYALAADPARPLQRLVLRDGHTRGGFALFGVTASRRPGPASRATAARRAAQLTPRPRLSAARLVRLTSQDELEIHSGALHACFRLRPGLELASLTSDYLPGLGTAVWAGSIFAVAVGDAQVRSAAAQVAKVEQTGPEAATLSLSLQPLLPLTATLQLAAVPEDELRMTLRLQALDKLTAEPVILFPLLEGGQATPAARDTWLFYPCRGTLISQQPGSWSMPYGGMFPLQVMGLFASRGGGLYVRTEYTQIVDRRYEAQKTALGTTLAVRYPFWRGDPLNAVIGVNADDWHGQLAAYQRWRQSWFKPAAPRKEWFRRVFNFRQQFLSFAVPRNSGMFDPATKTFHLKEVLEHDRAAFGGVDYLHLFDWGWSPQSGRCGDYAPWDYLGGSDRFRQAIGELQQSGLPVGLYIEGYLVSPQSSLFKRAQAWQVIKASGEPLEAFAPDINMCPWVQEWQAYLADVYARVRRETGALGYYLDEYGFAHDGHACYATTHGHPAPIYAAGGELQMTQKIRAALGPECALYTEETPCDVTMQWQDGSFTYAIASLSDHLSPHHVNLTRFAVPDFKTIEIITCDRPLGENLEALRRILFNGEAIWLEGIAEDWFDPRALEFIRRMHAVLSGHADCFTSLHPEALVPTCWEGLYANRFPAEDGKRCIWTIYWTGARTLRGPLLPVGHRPGVRYRELWEGRQLHVQRVGRQDLISATIHPHEVLVILQEGS